MADDDYGRGWVARASGRPYNRGESDNWRLGWLDCLLIPCDTNAMNDNDYDIGWNARIKGEPYNRNESVDWRLGWLDCDDTLNIESELN